MTVIPACFFPTTVLLIDDHINTLENTKERLDPSFGSYLTYYKPRKALEHLQQLEQDGYMDQWFYSNMPGELSIDIAGFHEQIYNSDRFNLISTIIVDYDMPGMNGLELCAQIKSPHIQKIMLTGAADDKIAIKAFNDGLINGFIWKNDKEVKNQLNKMIKNSQQQFFLSMTKTYMETITSEPEKAFILQPPFLDLFNNLIHENKITEYYLKNSNGHFLFLNSQGQPSALFMFDAEDIDMLNGDLLNQVDIELEKNPLLTTLLRDLSERRVMIATNYWGNVDVTKPLEWIQHSYILNQLAGVKDCYWFYMPYKDPIENVVSFADFKRQSE